MTLIGRDDLGAVSFARVAFEAGVSKGQVQHYFATQRDLIVAAAILIRERMEERIRPKLTISDPIERLEGVLVAMLPTTKEATLNALASRSLFHAAVHDPKINSMYIEGMRAAVMGVASMINHPDSVALARASLRLVAELGDQLMLGSITKACALGELNRLVADIASGGHEQPHLASARGKMV